MMVRNLLAWAILVMCINSALLVMAIHTNKQSLAYQLFSGALSWVPEEERISVTNPDTQLDPNVDFGEKTSERNIILSTAKTITTLFGIEFLIDEIVKLVKFLFAFLLIVGLVIGGTIFFMNEIGLPVWLTFLIGVPATIISVAGMFQLLQYLASILRGVMI